MEKTAGWSHEINAYLRELSTSMVEALPEEDFELASETIIDCATEVASKLEVLQLPRPSIFTTSDGGFRFEWLVVNRSHMLLDIRPSRTLPNLVEYEFYCLTLTEGEVTSEVTYETISTAEIVHKCYESYLTLTE